MCRDKIKGRCYRTQEICNEQKMQECADYVPKRFGKNLEENDVLRSEFIPTLTTKRDERESGRNNNN